MGLEKPIRGYLHLGALLLLTGACGSSGSTPEGTGGSVGQTGGRGAAGGAGGSGGTNSTTGGTAMTGVGGGTPIPGCPSKPPFDETDAALVQRCTQPVVAAVGNGLRRAFSYDGQDWFGDVWFPANFEDQNEESHRDVAIGNGIIVMVGDGGIFTSYDAGNTFEKKDTGRTLHNSAVLFFKGAFWVVGGTVHTSTDGKTWTSWKDTDTLPGGVKATFGASDGATDGNLAVFVSADRFRTFDGKDWTEAPLPVGVRGGSITYANGRFVNVTGLHTVTASSVDGKTWTVGGMGGNRFDTVIWDGSMFFASGTQYDVNAQTSPDGLTWTKVKMSTGIGPVIHMGTFFVGANAGTLYRSVDGRNWILPHMAAGDIKWGFARMAAGPVLKTAP